MDLMVGHIACSSQRTAGIMDRVPGPSAWWANEAPPCYYCPPPAAAPVAVCQPQQGHFDPDELISRLNKLRRQQEAREAREAREAQRRGGRTFPWDSDGGAPGELAGAQLGDAARCRRDGQTEVPQPGAVDLITRLRSRSVNHASTHTNVPGAAHPNGYHHVPQVAAAQFTRTTTVDSMRYGSSARESSDPLSRPPNETIRFSVEWRPITAEEAARDRSSVWRALKRARAVRADRERAARAERERNQVYHVDTMDDVAPRVEQLENVRPAAADSPEVGDLSRSLAEERKKKHRHRWYAAMRRHSTGNADVTTATTATTMTDNRNSHAHRSVVTLGPLPGVAETTSPPLEELTRVPGRDERRVDWTQSDEPAGPGRRRLSSLAPLVRKVCSLAAIGRRSGSKASLEDENEQENGNGNENEDDNGEAVTPEKEPETPKSRRESFFAMFRR